MPNDVQENRITRLLNTDQNGTLYTSFWLQIFKTDLKMITSVKVLTNSPQPFGMQHQGFSTVRDCNWDRIGCICRDINKHDKMATWPRPMFKTLQPTKWTIFGSLAHSLHQCDRWKLPFTFSQFFREVFQLPALSIRILNLLQLLKSISATNNNITPIRRKQQRGNGTSSKHEMNENEKKVKVLTIGRGNCRRCVRRSRPGPRWSPTTDPCSRGDRSEAKGVVWMTEKMRVRFCVGTKQRAAAAFGLGG